MRRYAISHADYDNKEYIYVLNLVHNALYQSLCRRSIMDKSSNQLYSVLVATVKTG